MVNYSEEEQVWENWIKHKDGRAADQLVRKYMYLVNYHCKRIGSHLPANVDKDDIKSLGLMGLYDALNKFDTSRDLKFDTYASFRIKGAILDGLRKEDWLPRSVREKAKSIERASQELEQQLQRPVTSHELAAHLNVSEKEVESSVKDALFANVLSMEEKMRDNEGDNKEEIGYILPDENAATPEQSAVTREDSQELAEGIRQLNKNEQMVISLFYNEELTLTEIGQVLDLTTSRISQIHRKAIFKLKNILTEIKKAE